MTLSKLIRKLTNTMNIINNNTDKQRELKEVVEWFNTSYKASGDMVTLERAEYWRSYYEVELNVSNKDSWQSAQDYIQFRVHFYIEEMSESKIAELAEYLDISFEEANKLVLNNVDY